MPNTTAILEERGGRYGKFREQAQIVQDLKSIMYSTRNYYHLAADQRESLDMIAGKISRILNGDPNYEDSWRDIAGYAQLVADRLIGNER